MSTEQTQAYPELTTAMRRYHRAGFAALIMAGLSGLCTVFTAADLFECPSSLRMLLAGATVWFIMVAWYTLRRSDFMAKRTIRKLDRSAIMRLERIARASEPDGTNDYMYLKARLDEEQARIDRHGGVMSLLYLDLVNLEAVGEQFGAQVRDRVLEETHELIATHLRQFDALGRLGGSEFLVMLPHTNRRDARKVAGALGKAIADYTFPVPGGQKVDVARLAIGVAAYPLNADTSENAVAAARNAMEKVKAKKNGGGIGISEQFIRLDQSGQQVVSEVRQEES